ncbi:hypothetical protein [Catellatospora methionotrophica]|uniref:hypothetical protein n=1 Tax=Catellatospora methionotrophica TaxID=121620 RepID=UPI0033D766C6
MGFAWSLLAGSVAAGKASGHCGCEIISTKQGAGLMIALELAHRVASLDGTSIVEVIDAAERKVTDAARRAAEEG